MRNIPSFTKLRTSTRLTCRLEIELFINHLHKLKLYGMNCTTFRNFASAILLFSSLAIVSCNSDETNTADEDNKDTSTVSTDTTSQAIDQANRAEATIAATYPDTAVTGTATFETVNGKVKMVLNITAPSKANKTLAVHIHEHA